MPNEAQIEARKRLEAAGYRTGLSMHDARCGSCEHVSLSGKLYGTTAHDRHCRTLQAGVKTHGGCRMHKALPAGGASGD